MIRPTLSDPIFNDVDVIKSREDLVEVFGRIEYGAVNGYVCLLRMVKTILELWECQKNEVYIKTGELTKDNLNNIA